MSFNAHLGASTLYSNEIDRGRLQVRTSIQKASQDDMPSTKGAALQDHAAVQFASGRLKRCPCWVRWGFSNCPY